MADLKRRRWLDGHRPQDRREIIVVHGDGVSCEDYKGMTAGVVMECFDALMPPYRALCNEYNLKPATWRTSQNSASHPKRS